MQLALLKCSDKAKEVRRLGLVLLATLALPALPEQVHSFHSTPSYRPISTGRRTSCPTTPSAAPL